MPDLTQNLQKALGDGYRVERELGAGGFAVVYLVRDLGLKRDLAVKVLSPDLITSHSVLERFRREAETVAGLSHPNIVPLHFIGQKDDLLYLVMACIKGESVHDRLTRTGQLSIEETERIIREVASALAHAHSKGVIHRDIKPQNVLLDEDGRALVTDFGIARTADAVGLTMSGMFVGTPEYLAPEQLAGEPTDHRGDIYALGVMSYQMLTGHLPYEATTPTALLMKRLAGPPPPIAEVRKDVPPGLSQIIDGCLKPDPAERIPDGKMILRLLNENSSGDVKPFKPSGHRSLAPYLAAILVLLLVGIAYRCYGPGSTTTDAAPMAMMPAVVPTLVQVAGGMHSIGSNTGPLIARPEHHVSLPEFAIEKNEVSVRDYAAFIRTTNAPVPWTDGAIDSAKSVTRVLWSEAASYCAWKYPGGRLPSEEEWEAAARAVEDGQLSGVTGLVGNVWEWTSSSLRSYAGGRTMPDSMAAFRVIRGGAADTPDSLRTVWIRGYSRPSAAREELGRTGFRCAAAAR